MIATATITPSRSVHCRAAAAPEIALDAHEPVRAELEMMRARTSGYPIPSMDTVLSLVELVVYIAAILTISMAATASSM